MRALVPIPWFLGCSGPTDSGEVADCARVDSTVGSIVHACWEQPSTGTVNLHYRVAGEDWRPTLMAQLDAGKQELPLLGLPYGATVDWYVQGSQGDRLAEGNTATDPLPDGLPEIEILADVPDLHDPSMNYLLASIDEPSEVGTPEASWTIVFDRQGRIVWALPTPSQRLTLHPRVARDGKAFLIDLNSHFGIFDRGAASRVQRVTVLGTVEASWDTPGLHHPFTDTNDGSLAWGAWGEDLETIEVLDVDGNQRTLWDCTDFHEERDAAGTSCSSNTLAWDPTTDRYLFSSYTTHTVVEIDGDNGETTRWFGQMPDGWAFDPDESEFIWQHGAHFTEQGTLLVSARRSTEIEETVIREYELDEDSDTLRQIWSFGQDQGIFAPELGEAHRLPRGNTLHNYGTAARIREVTPEGEVVWDVGFFQGSWLGRTTPIANLYDLL